MIDWLVATLVASSALMALVLALREPVRRRFGPSVAYALWLLPAARMVLPSFTTTVERIVPAGPRTDMPSLLPFSAGVGGGDASAIPTQLLSWPAVAIALWLGGAAIMLLCGLSTYLAQRRAILADGVLLARIGSIRLVRSERVHGPLAFGLVDRVVIVPFDFDHRFSERERCLALDHELAHHRCGDLVANVIAFVLLCLQWFNPLAWAAHAAFRFDQEAACDARVLDKACVGDRCAYGEAIAKAASGRNVLFAGALDRPSTLSRRLTIMTRVTDTNRRKFGFLLVGACVLLGLPLTASWAVNYVDVPSPPTRAPAQPQLASQAVAAAPGAPTVATTPASARNGALVAAAPAPAAPQNRESEGYTLPGGVILGKGDVAFFANDDVVIHGRAKHLEQLTRGERAELRASIAKSLREIERERVQLPARLAEARRELERIRSGAFKRELMADLEDLRRDLAEVDREAAEMRAAGEDPEKRKAEILAALREAQSVDVDKEIREALEEANPDKIAGELRDDMAQMIRMRAKLDQLDRR